MDNTKYPSTVALSSSLKVAMEKIEKNSLGALVVIDSDNKVLGVLTDGDIRRYFLAGGQINDKVSRCLNENCTVVTADTSREHLLKLLDNGIRIIPVVTNDRTLVEVYHSKNIPQPRTCAVSSRAKAPVRLSFGGGGSDLTNHFMKDVGFTLNSSISLFSHATLIKRPSSKITISSIDINSEIEFSSIEELTQFNRSDHSLRLLLAVIKIVKPTFGFHLILHSDYPICSGLGGSAAVSAAILGCFNEFRETKWTKHQIAELAFEAERIELGIKGGWQDQYVTCVGGFCFMEFNKDKNYIQALKLEGNTIDELEANLVLCFTGDTHDSGKIHSGARSQSALTKSAEIARVMAQTLARGNTKEFGELIDEAWQIKRRQNNSVSSPKLDKLYQEAINAGATGGKLLGAGGGGFFLFIVPPENRILFNSFLNTHGLKSYPFNFSDAGLKSWKVTG